MTEKPDKFSLEELCSLTDVPLRTARYYIQNGLVDRPEGAKRGAYYTRQHLEQMLTIRKWQRAGLSLERIRELVSTSEEDQLLPPVRQRMPGEVSVRSHVRIHQGVEMIIDPSEANLSPEVVRELIQKMSELATQIVKGTHE